MIVKPIQIPCCITREMLLGAASIDQRERFAVTETYLSYN